MSEAQASMHPDPDFLAQALPAVRDLAPYEPGKPIEELERELGIVNIIKLASNESPLGPAPGVRRILEAELGRLALYPDGSGHALKQALAGHLDVAPAQVTLGNGSNDLLNLVAQAFLAPGRNAVMSAHAFAIYALATRAVGAEARVAPALPADAAQPCGHDLAAMAERMDGNTAVIFIANPNNPTGTWIDRDALENFLDAVPPRVVVVLDEAYFEYVQQAGYPDGCRLLARYPNLLVTRTFSKAYGLAALRVGYGVSHPALADLLNRLRQPFNVNSLGLAAALAALADTDHLAAAVAINGAGLAQLSAGLAALGLPYIPSVGNFITFRVPDAADLNQRLLSAGIIVRPVAGYGLPESLRVSVGLPEHNTRFLETLGRLLQS
ncbi:MAG: histidinol-phosphate transaminase [Candidatus Macondimonas sp.]